MSVLLRAAGNVYGIGTVLGVDAEVTFEPYGVPSDPTPAGPAVSFDSAAFDVDAFDADAFDGVDV